jgi:acyl-CoA thioester hydrolase
MKLQIDGFASILLKKEGISVFYTTMMPRFSETDALGHINNTVIPVWFESARVDIFRIFVPSLDIKDWNLIVANINIDFLDQIYMHEPVEIRTGIQRIGNSSFVVYQEAYQGGRLVSKGTSVLVYYDYQAQQSRPIPADIRRELEKHLVNTDIPTER